MQYLFPLIYAPLSKILLIIEYTVYVKAREISSRYCYHLPGSRAIYLHGCSSKTPTNRQLFNIKWNGMQTKQDFFSAIV